MRTAFIESLTEVAHQNKDVMLVTGDLGFGVVVDFAEQFPNQFLNIGVAEQNMAGVAAGLAMAGKIVYTYSIANFPTLRCLEQIRNDVCYHDANVVTVAVGGGMAYGSLGMSHHATEDLAIMRAIPNLTVLAPGDPQETALAVRTTSAGIGPAYLRLGRAGEPMVHDQPIELEVGKAIEVRAGRDGTLISTGGMLATCVEVARQLSTMGVEVGVLSMHSISPIDDQAIIAAASATKNIVTVEEHSLVGGLGSAVAEVLVDDRASGWNVLRLGLPREFSGIVGDQEYLKQRLGLDAGSIMERVRDFITMQ